MFRATLRRETAKERESDPPIRYTLHTDAKYTLHSHERGEKKKKKKKKKIFNMIQFLILKTWCVAEQGMDQVW